MTRLVMPLFKVPRRYLKICWTLLTLAFLYFCHSMIGFWPWTSAKVRRINYIDLLLKGKLSWAAHAFKWSRLWQHARFYGHFSFMESALLSVMISFAAKDPSNAGGLPCIDAALNQTWKVFSSWTAHDSFPLMFRVLPKPDFSLIPCNRWLSADRKRRNSQWESRIFNRARKMYK